MSKDHPLAQKESVTTQEMSKEKLIFFNADSVQNQLLKLRFELDGCTPSIIMKSSQIYTTLQFIKSKKYGCFFYSCMTDKFSGVVGIPLATPTITASSALTLLRYTIRITDIIPTAAIL